MLRKRLALLFTIFLVLVAPCTFSQLTFGGIVGVVKDPSQSAVAGAQLTLASLDDRTQRTAFADPDGAFEFINLKPGRYELAVAGAARLRLSRVQVLLPDQPPNARKRNRYSACKFCICLGAAKA
jgi:hypothetical protein